VPSHQQCVQRGFGFWLRMPDGLVVCADRLSGANAPFGQPRCGRDSKTTVQRTAEDVLWTRAGQSSLAHGAAPMALMRLALWPGEVHSCPYLAAREARLGWIDPRAPLTQALYSS